MGSRESGVRRYVGQKTPRISLAQSFGLIDTNSTRMKLWLAVRSRQISADVSAEIR